MFGLPTDRIKTSGLNELAKDPTFWAVWGVIGILIASRWPALNIPYFWDEAWVYVPAVKAMAQNGPSMLPSVIPDDLSRGHPLLFHFLGGIWIKVFGAGFVSLHGFALTISCCLLFAVYLLGRTFFSPIVGLFTAILLGIQPVFQAQASMVLPEVMLALWSVLCVYHYLKGNAGGYIIFGAALALTKETGLVLIGILGLWTLVDFLVIRKMRLLSWETIRPLLILSVPFGVVSAFFILQYATLGWLFYPGHTDLLVKDFGVFEEKVIFFYRFLFEEQGRYVMTITLFTVCACAGISKSKAINLLYLVIPFLAILVYLEPKFLHKSLTVCLILLMWLILMYRLWDLAKVYRFSATPILLIPLFILGYLAFSSANFSTLRYLMSLFPFFLLLVVWGLEVSLMKFRWVFYLSILIICGSVLFLSNGKDAISDCYPNYVDAVRLGEEVVHYLEHNNLYGQSLATSFIMGIYITQPSAGYRKTSKEFKRVYNYFAREATYFLIGNMEPNAKALQYLNEKENITLVKRFEKGPGWFELYKKE
ncbi:MAG: glycosyltransferase family 39 protein [Bacteroidota bacterium]